MTIDRSDAGLDAIVERYRALLALTDERLRTTTNQRTFEDWIGRRLGVSVGGAYAFRHRERDHVVLINLARIDLTRPKALEIVVAEELIHMRDRLDGDLRRHAKHGHDRIARRVAALTDSTMEEVRNCLLPRKRRTFRYVYACPTCGATVRRRRTGVWSCGRCAPRFDARHLLRLVEDHGAGGIGPIATVRAASDAPGSA